jgi:hypothetical protein
VRAAVERTVRLDTMPYDPAPTVGAGWSKRVDRALKTIEAVGIRIASHADLESLVVFVATNLTNTHLGFPP